MTNDELRALIQEVVEAQSASVEDVVRSSVRETLITMGMDASNPLKLQENMAFLRDLQAAHEAVKSKGILVIVGMLVTSVAAAAWLGFKGMVAH